MKGEWKSEQKIAANQEVVENCKFIGFECNILQVMIGPQISLIAFGKAEGS